MRRITSINNAIKYFSENTKIETRKNSKGEEYKVYIPPAGFHRMNVAEPSFDTKGRLVGYIAHHFQSFQWRNYAEYLLAHKDKISKIVVYHD